MNHKEINIKDITISKQSRPVDDTHVLSLSNSIREIGLLQPIGVTPIGKRYRLEYGLHRYHACKALKMKTIPAYINAEEEGGEGLVRMAAENLNRRGFTEAETFTMIAHMKSLSYSREKMAGALNVPVTKLNRYFRVTDIATEFIKRTGLDTIKIIERFAMFIGNRDLNDELDKMINWVCTEWEKDPDEINLQNFMVERYVSEHSADLHHLYIATKKWSAEGIPLCQGCQYNTATAPDLFGDSARAKCINAECFSKKLEHQAKGIVEKAMDEGLIIVLKSYYYGDNIVGDFLEEGLYYHQDSFEVEDYCEFDTFEKYAESNDWDLSSTDADEILEEREEYDATMADQKEKLDDGYFIALLIGRDWDMQKVLVKGKPEKEESDGKTVAKTLTVDHDGESLEFSSEDIDEQSRESVQALVAEVDKRQGQIDRNLELENEKSMQAVMEKFDDILANSIKAEIANAVWGISGDDFHPHDIAHALYHSLDWHYSARIRTYYNPDEKDNNFDVWGMDDFSARELIGVLLYFWYRMKASKEQFASKESRAYYDISQKLVPDWVAQIEATNRAVYEKRNQSQTDKIDKAVKRIKELTTSEIPD